MAQFFWIMEPLTATPMTNTGRPGLQNRSESVVMTMALVTWQFSFFEVLAVSSL